MQHAGGIHQGHPGLRKISFLTVLKVKKSHNLLMVCPVFRMTDKKLRKTLLTNPQKECSGAVPEKAIRSPKPGQPEPRPPL